MAHPSFSTKRLDHLGIVAGICNHIGLIDVVDQQLPAPERQVSHGEALQAMILNALGFSSRPLYLTPEFFDNKPLDLLIRPGITPQHLNDDGLGRTLDACFEHGVTELFSHIARQAVERFEVPTQAVCPRTPYGVSQGTRSSTRSLTDSRRTP